MKTIQLIALLIVGILLWQCAADDGDALAFGDGSGTQGIAGSTARFAVSGDFLYVVNNSQLQSVDISNPRDPFLSSTQDLGWGIETIFGYRSYLFIGGQNGMQVFGQRDNGEAFFLSQYMHQTACDPVIANDKYAYITIRGGTICGSNNLNALITVDVTDIRNPEEMSVINMINPRGLTFFQGDLYVAEGIYGLKRFDLSNPALPALDTFFTQIPANDMIGLANTLIVTGEEGILQYGYDQDSLEFLSQIY